MSLVMINLTPFFPRESEPYTTDMIFELDALYSKLNQLHSNMPKVILSEIVKNINHVNNYYSNQIESDGTHPIDIERICKEGVMANKTGSEALKKRLALSYHAAQQEIMQEHYPKRLIERAKFFHKSFYDSQFLHEDQLYILDESTAGQIPVTPGKFRERMVQIGNHIPPEETEINRLLKEWDAHYSLNEKDVGYKKLLKAFVAHHRLMYVHPFLDGNGRAGRLVLESMLKEAAPNSHGLWSISRGLAKSKDDYFGALENAGMIRQGAPYDGAGSLSERGLVRFVNYMRETANKEVDFMLKLMDLSKLESRLSKFVDFSDKEIPKEMKMLIPHLLVKGEIKKSDLPEIWHVSERKSRDVQNTLKKLSLIKDSNESHRTPIRLNISAEVMSFIFPEIMPAHHVREIEDNNNSEEGLSFGSGG